MLFSIIVPCYNCEKYLQDTLESIIVQKNERVDLELIVIDGNSTDGTHKIIESFSEKIDKIIIETDSGPAEAINKGLKIASGDIVAWLNADDLYLPETLNRVSDSYRKNPEAAFFFGKCLIVDETLKEIRRGITMFKHSFYPLNSRFTYQCINYISQPASFFNSSIIKQIDPLREDMVAAWDYEFFLRLWKLGRGVEIKGGPLSVFRWHDQSISGRNFKIQFKEELDATINDTGKYSLQTIIHSCVRIGIVTIYSVMNSSFIKKFPILI